jgi:hypothetical protein
MANSLVAEEPLRKNISVGPMVPKILGDGETTGLCA